MSGYKLISFEVDGRIRAGILIGDRVYDIADAVGSPVFSTLEDVFFQWRHCEVMLGRFADSPTRPGFDVAEVKLTTPLRRPGTVYCAGANYQDHIEKMALKQGVEMGQSPKELGLPPYYFIKSNHCLAGPNSTISFEGKALDYEGELAAVIGDKISNISTDNALKHVAGYTIANDLSARDRFVRQDIPFQSPFRFDWLRHKNFDGSCPIGPAIVPARFIADPQNLKLRTWVNGDIRQDSSTRGMVYSLAELIAALSRVITLHPGDIVLSGTPAGVGAETGNFLRSGDEVKVEIEKIGLLVNRIETKEFIRSI